MNSTLPDPAKYPLVTVGIPTCNGGDRISKAVRSVLDQGYPNVEIVISDNCSSDNTMVVCRELSAGNPCIRYYRQPRNIGMMPNFEFVLRQAAGDYFMWMSDDDSLECGILQKYVGFLSNNREYALVSGRIKYWIGDRPVFCEEDFNIEQGQPAARMIKFYFKVVYGSVFYGLMQKKIALRIPLKNRIGDDWHFVACLAYFGKIKTLDCIGYNKKCGGISRSFKEYAENMGATPFAASYPHVQIALDAFHDILRDSPVYATRRSLQRLILAVSSFLTILVSYYGKQYPFIVGGKLKRLAGGALRGIVAGS